MGYVKSITLSGLLMYVIQYESEKRQRDREAERERERERLSGDLAFDEVRFEECWVHLNHLTHPQTPQ